MITDYLPSQPSPYGGPKVTNVAEVLKSAKKVISDPNVWWQQGIPSKGTMCASMAIGFVVVDVDRDLSMAAHAILAQAIGLGDTAMIPFWNDKKERTHAEVMAAFDKAIDLALGKDKSLKLPDSITQLLNLADGVEPYSGAVPDFEIA